MYLDISQNWFGKNVQILRHGPRNLSRQQIANELCNISPHNIQQSNNMISKVKYMPGYGVDIFSSDGGLLRQLGVVKAEVGWDPAPHPEKTTSVDKLCIALIQDIWCGFQS